MATKKRMHWKKVPGGDWIGFSIRSDGTYRVLYQIKVARDIPAAFRGRGLKYQLFFVFSAKAGGRSVSTGYFKTVDAAKRMAKPR